MYLAGPSVYSDGRRGLGRCCGYLPAVVCHTGLVLDVEQLVDVEGHSGGVRVGGGEEECHRHVGGGVVGQDHGLGNCRPPKLARCNLPFQPPPPPLSSSGTSRLTVEIAPHQLIRDQPLLSARCIKRLLRER